ncbi:agmatine deiminase family protein [Parasedimentitalea psychrophila]|uniref:Agmatine deiminase family protein n=1 Tax=Parasedimentitalea psychrophila TaxID=2997337 RepID=A0A9Y2P388_9RHOB|nr:agmatine deiminase family protein [Parasedimentitalea psychrophila]WIY27421.1 agmatine deiminase family protein [Parasedimentitalea psychrophila]
MSASFSADFRMPAEWLPHARTWMAWPLSEPVYGDTLAAGRSEHAAVAREIAKFEPVTMVYDPNAGDGVEQLRDLPNLTLLELPLDDSWLRDTGPTFVTGEDGSVAGIDWTFDGWGGLHPANNDAAIAERILRAAGVRRFGSDMVFEGGALSIDDAGTVLTTRQCFEHRTRDGGPTSEEFEAELKARLGARKIIWLERTLEGDSTNGHVDVVAAFTSPGHVVVQISEDFDDPDYDNLLNNLTILEQETDADGRPLTVHKIVAPPVSRNPDGSRRMLSYINFYIVNGGVVVPQYGMDETDAAAIGVLQNLFPDRRVVGVMTPTVADAGGNIHCITQQQPKGALSDA